MKLDCVLTAVNENELYLEFVPIFIKTWKALFPEIDVKIIMIMESIPEGLVGLQEHLILFKPTEGMSTVFISQYIRILFPAILNYENGILITDMDMLPMNRRYYSDNIQSYPNDYFVSYRNVLEKENQIAICYNVANSSTWSSIFSIHNEQDIIERLKEKAISCQWTTDQLDLYTALHNWEHFQERYISLNDRQTKFKRLDRSLPLKRLQLPRIKRAIQRGLYTDYHCHRPYSAYQKDIEIVLGLL